jgi:hypothetical protein
MRSLNCNIVPNPDAVAALVADTGQPIPVALIPDPHNAGRCALELPDAPFQDGPYGANLTVLASGFQKWQGRITLPPYGQSAEGISIELKASGALPFPQGVVNRGPLPQPFPSSIVEGDYYTALRAEPPAGADKRFWRCDFGCVTIPGLPWVEGMEGANYDRVLTGFLGRYTPDWQNKIIAQHTRNGYTHFMRWVSDELLGPAQVSVAAYVDQCKRIKDRGIPYIAHSFLSKTFVTLPDLNYMRNTFGPVIDALLKADMLDIAIIGFELTLITNGSTNQFDLIDYFTVERGLNEGNGIPAYTHEITGYTWPGPVGGIRDRAQWWNAQRGKLTGLLYQCTPNMPLRETQDRIRDTTDNAGEGFVGRDSGFGHDFDFVACETRLSRAFGDNADLNEDDLNTVGWLTLCTPGALPVMGFGCGARRPDGSYL